MTTFFSPASVYAQLTSFAKLENFWSLFNTAFGSSYDFATAASFRSQWQSQDFSLFPQIEIVSNSILGKANGAYAISTNKIYLSDRFVSSASQQSLEAVLLEEFGHFVDAKVNKTDTLGDEGELFSDVVQGVNLNASDLSRIKAEDDHAIAVIGGQKTTIEQSAGTIIQLTNNNTDDYSPLISENNVVWSEYDGNDEEIYFYNGTTTTQLTNNNTDDFSPLISGNNVVWRRAVRNYDDDIYFYNGTTTTQLTNNNKNDYYPLISGNNVVWSGDDGNNDDEIYFYNGTTTTQLTNNDTYDYLPQISGNNVVWGEEDSNYDEYGNYEKIYFYNGTTTTQLTNNNTHNDSAQISGNNVVWSGFDGNNDNEIYFYNGTITTQLTNNNTSDYSPLISGNNVVWIGSDFGPDSSGNISNKIYFYNGTTTIQLTDNNTYNDDLQISGNNVVWQASDVNDDDRNEIYFYNGTTITQLTNNAGNYYYPQISISGNNVVWSGFDGNNDNEIYFYNGTTTTQLTNNNTNEDYPQISGNNIVWQGWDGNDSEIYTYQISSALPTLSIAPTNASQAEGNSGTKAFTFTVTRSINTTGINAVNWTVTGSGTNPANVTDFAGGVLPTGTVSFAAGETSKVITVNVQGDLTNEPNDGFAVTLSSPTNGATITTAIATGTITNDDEDALSVITLAVNPASVSEDAATNLVYAFTRTGPTTNALTVNYRITGTADATDYTGATPGTGKTITFNPGSATATLTIDPTADAVIEPDETVILTLATGTDYTIGTTNFITGTITNDDTAIEIAGNTKLIKDGTNKYFAQLGTATPIAIKINGTQISKDFFGTDWQTLAVETVNGENQVFWKNVTGNFVHIWKTDSNWNWVSSEGQWALNSAEAFNKETAFGVDANGDGVIGSPYTAIETVGNTKFIKDGTNKYFAQVGTATPITIKINNGQIYQDIFGTDWQTLAVETVNGENQVLWKNTTGNFLHIWHLDSNWNWVSSEGQWALNSAEAFNKEIIFGVDANGDSVIGSPYTVVESVGNTKFVKDDTNKYFAQVGTATPIAIKINNGQIYQNIFGTDWQTLAVETVNGENQVLWKNVTGNFVHIWHMDSNWNWVSSEGQWALNSTEAFNKETLFGVDANSDGFVGNSVSLNLIGSSSNDTLIGGAKNDVLKGLGGKDLLTGGLDSDRFDYTLLTDSLLANFDVITDFTSNDLLVVSTARAGFSDAGAIASLDATAIGNALTSTNFGANFAAQFSFGTRSFIAINDANAGFNQANDAIIEITGLTGTLGLTNFVIA